MKDLILRRYSLLILLALVLSSCSSNGENGSSSNTNSSPVQANSNSASQPSVAQNGTPTAVPNTSPPAVQQIPPPATPDKSAAPQNANSASSAPSSVAPAPNGKAPKLVVTETKIDFGQQYQGKTLNRAIAIKNGGKADLNIESVVPSWGCTTVDFPKVLRPGQVGKIKVKVETGNTSGPKSKSVTIKTNDPADPSHIVQFAFEVK